MVSKYLLHLIVWFFILLVVSFAMLSIRVIGLNERIDWVFKLINKSSFKYFSTNQKWVWKLKLIGSSLMWYCLWRETRGKVFPKVINIFLHFPYIDFIKVEKRPFVAKDTVKWQISVGERQNLNNKDLISVSLWLSGVRNSLVVIIHKAIPKASFLLYFGQLHQNYLRRHRKIKQDSISGQYWWDFLSSKSNLKSLWKRGIQSNCYILKTCNIIARTLFSEIRGE